MTNGDHWRFGDLLRRRRTAAALSQEALAARAGVSARAVSDLERGVHRAPRLETVRLLAAALQLGPAERAELLAVARPEATTSAAASAPSAPFATIPRPPTRLIGREAEQAALAGLLGQDGVRLVTLTGPGGVGKTRLALAVAEGVARDGQGRYTDGVCFVDLSPLTDPALVVTAIATALGVREVATEPPRETLSGWLRPRHLFLVLDNCEHVLAAATDIAALVEACPDLVILATSRVPLHIRAEWDVTIGPLPSPDVARLPPVAELEQVAAVALFVERARAADAGFTLTTGNAAAIAAICQRLDGLPLAIELAAARVNVLPPVALLARLETRLPLLTGGERDLPARQRTMRDTIAWSYELLPHQAQAAFQRLAVFAGGCTLDAAEAVVAGDGSPDIIASITALVDSSMLRQGSDRAEQPRFRMLETVREYGLEQLAATGGMEDTRQRHAEYFARLAEAQAPGTALFMNLERTAALAADYDNLRLVLAWFSEHDDIDTLLRVCTALYAIWLTRGPYGEGLQWIGRALARSGTVPSRGRVGALAAASRLAAFAGDDAQAAAFVREGLQLARTLADPFMLVQALNAAGLVAYRQDRYDRAEALLTEAHRLVDALTADPSYLGSEAYFAPLVLGDVALAQERFADAEQHYEAALLAAGRVGAVWGTIDAQVGLGGVHLCRGETALAAVHYGRGLDRAGSGGRHVGGQLAAGVGRGGGGDRASRGWGAPAGRRGGHRHRPWRIHLPPGQTDS